MISDNTTLLVLLGIAFVIAVYLLRKKLFGKKSNFNYYDDTDDDDNIKNIKL